MRHLHAVIRERYVGLMSGVGSCDGAQFILMSFVGLIALCIVAVALTGTDVSLFLAINSTSARLLPDDFVAVITMFGEGLWLTAFLSAFLLLAPRVNFAVLYASPIALLLTHGPKQLLHVARPSSVLASTNVHLIGAPTAANSCPSGHALVTALVATTVILGCSAVRRRPAVIVLILIVLCSIGLSRIAIGAHWPIDVLWGMMLGVATGALGVHLTYRFPQWECERGLSIAEGIFLLCAFALLCTRGPYASADVMRDGLACVGILCASGAVLRSLATGQRRNPQRVSNAA
jgi:membrane-associated phospholipid phosphatase